MLFLAALLSAPAAAFAADIPASVSKEGAATRVIFDFPVITPYKAVSGDNKLVLTFTTPDHVLTPRIGGPIKAATSTHPDANTCVVTLTLPPGAVFQDFRLLRKIVVNIKSEPDKKPPPAKTAEEAKPAAKEAKKETKAPPAPSAAPVKPVEKTELAEKPVSPPEQAAAAAVAAATDTQTGVTKIIVSMIEPTRIAVFQRFDKLWLVLDTKLSSAQPPGLMGPLSASLGSPKVMNFDSGTAYRYNMPPRSYVSVNKQGLNWEISLNDSPVQPPAPQQISIAYDETSKKNKLMVPLKNGGKVLEIEDPDAGDKIEVVPVSQPDARIDQTRRFDNVEILNAAAGLALRPLSDDVTVNRIEDMVLVTSPDGITATPGATAAPQPVLESSGVPVSGDTARLFDFPNWRGGGIPALNKNRREIETEIAAAKSPDARQESLMKLALLFFANNFGQEATGVLRLIEDENPDIADNANFIALRGAANAMAGHYPEAMQDLSNPAIQQQPEVALWRGFVAAATEEWHKASESFPKDNRLITEYPENIATPFTLYMAESALRLGQADTAKSLLSTLDITRNASDDPQAKAAIGYLKGEVARQENRPEEAIREWKEVAGGLDRLYHTKASLALANLELQQKNISVKEAIDRIDSLRFAWRGDGLEVQILHNLGLLKVQNGQYLEGMNDMKTAADLAEAYLQDADPIRADITRTFADIFNGGGAAKITPLEAVSVYNSFGTLVPPGSAGSQVMLKVADYLVTIDLLGKAEDILEDQLSHGYPPSDKISEVGAKLSAVYLIDNKPSLALQTLDRTENAPATAEAHANRAVLRARALSSLGRADEAVAALSKMETADAERLKADIFWHAQKWDQAAAAIERILPKPSADKPLSADDAGLVINAAVAYKLAGDRAGLKNLKERYERSMDGTPRAATFGVVTRDEEASGLADRDTMLKIAGEVDMFKGFLDSYKGGDNAGADTAKPVEEPK